VAVVALQYTPLVASKLVPFRMVVQPAALQPEVDLPMVIMVPQMHLQLLVDMVEIMVAAAQQCVKVPVWLVDYLWLVGMALEVQ
jgi:hypothetical protein